MKRLLLILLLALPALSARAAPTVLPYGKDARQFGELSLPPGSGPFPVIVMLHGGCWQAALPGVELMRGIAADMAARGFAVWNVDYRRIGDAGGGYPGTFSDTGAALDALRGLAALYPIDLAHVTALGHSAGGTLAVWAAARGRLPPGSALSARDPLPVERVVTLGGIDDLRAYHDSGMACGGAGTVEVLLGAGGRRGTDVYADTSPLALLPIGVPQLIVSGDADAIVPARFGEAYATAARAKGDPARALTLHADHMQLIDPASAAWQAAAAQIVAGR